jgi:hypothetical protein
MEVFARRRHSERRTAQADRKKIALDSKPNSILGLLLKKKGMEK